MRPRDPESHTRDIPKYSEVDRPRRVQGVREDSSAARILVVDGYPGLRVSMGKALEEAGYAVWTARSGRECLMMCERDVAGFDLLITALDIADMSGRQLVRKLRSWCPELRVIFMASGDEQGRGALRKPFSLAMLEHSVRRALGRRDAAASQRS
jgi:CheY-like chemotaxis protein